MTYKCKDKQRAYEKAYREANKEKVAAREKAYREANKEKSAARRRAYREANKDKELAREKAYYEANKEERLARQKAYREDNPHIVNAKAARRRAAKARATGPWSNTIEINALYREAKYLEEATGEAYEVDHEVPLVHPEVCGLHIACNLQVLKATDNLAKSNSFEV